MTLRAIPDRPLDATVVPISLQAGNQIGDAAIFPVILALNGSDPDILPGMTGRVKFLTEQLRMVHN